MTTRTNHPSATHSTTDILTQHSKDAERRVPSHRPSLLLVEDHAETAILMEYALRRWYRTDVVPTAEAALEKAAATRYDGFLIDISLRSQRNGINVLEVLRSDSAYRRTPMLAVTAHALPGDRERFLDAGFDAYVAKPFTADDLRAAVRRQIPTYQPIPAHRSSRDAVLVAGRAES